MNSIKYNVSLNILFFELGILAIPYDAMHIMPSTYAPLSAYFFSLSLIIDVINTHGRLKISKLEKLILITFAYMVFISLITVTAYLDTYKFYLRFIITFTIGLVCYFSVTRAFRCYSKKYSQEEIFQRVLDLVCKAYYIPIIVGFLEFFALYGILPYTVKTVLNGIFGGWQISRLCITNLEASWVSMHMLILISASFAMLNWSKRCKYLFELFCGIFFFCVVASMQGFLSLVFASFLYLLFTSIKDANFSKFLKNLSIILIILTISFVGFYQILLLDPNSYFASRVLNFISLKDSLATDSSVFVRIGYLLIHLLIFKDYILFGIGGGSFNYIFADYVIQYFPRSAYLIEIASNLTMKDAQTTVSVYFSVLSEFGLVGALLFVSFFIKSVNMIRCFSIKNINRVIFFLAVCLALPIQFGSWAFVPMWFALGLLVKNITTKHS